MKILLLFVFTIYSLITFASDSIPRQKISITGLTHNSNPFELSLKDFETASVQKKFELYDPYNSDKLTTFTTIPLNDFVKKYAAKSIKSVTVTAFDGYKIDISYETLKKVELFLAFKDQNGYLTLDRMGPVRIIENRKGKIAKDLLTKIGVNWVWQVKSIEFK